MLHLSLAGISQRFRAFLSAQDGVYGVVFAVALLPMLCLTGAAIDFAQSSLARVQINAAADAAVISAISDQVLKTSMTSAEQRSAARLAVEREFQAQSASGTGGWSIVGTTYTIEEANGAFRVKLCYNAEQPTSLLKLAGIPALPISNCVSSQTSSTIFVSVYALIDASGSMGIGATHTDQGLMETRLGCAFACHTLNDVQDMACNTAGLPITKDKWHQTTKCAKLIGAKTRFDVVRNAMIRVTDQAQALSKAANQYRLTVHKFSNYLTEIQAPTWNMSTARLSLTNMVMDQRGAGSNFYKVLADFTQMIPMSGDGSSPSSPKVFVMLLSDGIASRIFEEKSCLLPLLPLLPCRFEGNWRNDPDYVLESPYVDSSVRSQAFPARLCDGLKAKNATVLTLATEFDASMINDSHMKQVDNTLKTLALNGLKGCASQPSLAFSANLGPDVERAIGEMFAAVADRARLVR